MALSAKQMTYLYHHVVFPPKLPQESDIDAAQEHSLLEFVIQALEYLIDHVGDPHVETVKAAIATMRNLHNSRDIHGNICEVQVEAILANFAGIETDGAIPLEIKAQNAGILTSRSRHHLQFEFFELSPSNEAAMRSSRLSRTFPASALRIPIDRMASKDFRKSLAGIIAKMSTQTAPGFQPQARKNGKTEDENRDTTAPSLVTDFFMNFAAAFGDATEVECITKFTREDVLWSDCEQPWRRSPLWLLVRVSLQLVFTRKAAHSPCPDSLYKAFMIFMLTRLLESEKPHWNKLGSEFIYNTCAKLQRRLRKFEDSKRFNCLRESWTESIQQHIFSAHAFIENHWKGLSSTQSKLYTTEMRSLPPENDLDMSLPVLDEFLAAMKARGHDASSSTFRPSSTFPAFLATELPLSVNSPHDHTPFRVAAFEDWVERHLKSWIEVHLSNHTTCGELRGLIDHYFHHARAVYKDVPVSLSVMYLTLAELWIACDKSACTLYPSLRDYDPEMCLTEFQCLILPLKKHMERLHEVERYVQSRCKQAVNGVPSLYRSFGHQLSFAVRHFDQCEELQATLAMIERDATEKRKRKCEELQNLKNRHKDLMRQHNSSSCDSEEYVYNRRYGYKRSRHPSWCYRCSYKRQADALSIHIYEWPLSSDPTIAKATVFELKIPQAFGDWRDASVYMIRKVLDHREAITRKPSCIYTLDKHQDISHMLSPLYSRRRIVPLSEVKPYNVTHRKQKKAIPHLTEEDVCLDNALKYAYYDTGLGVLNAVAPICTEGIPKSCMYHMPQRSQVIERFTYRPPKLSDGLSANEVIASLSDCPPHMSIEEYKALTAVPLGVHLIYSNILTQLANSALDFTKAETQCLIFQTIQQVGLPSTDVERVNHFAISEEAFGRAMLEQLDIALRRVSENWESWRAAACFSLLARRISSLTKSREVHTRSLCYLARLRLVCFTWLRKLKERAVSSTDNEQKLELYSSATEIALLCTNTYDVESADFDMVLQQESAITILIQSSIIIQENSKSVRSGDQGLYSAMLQSYQVLMYRLFWTLRQFILEDSAGLRDAVAANWAAFKPTVAESWTSLDNPQEHWLVTTSGMLSVHFNLLTAELLIEGLPLSRLPPEFMEHGYYGPLFSKATLEVVPTDEPGLKFSAKYPYHGCKLHFGMNGPDMLVVAIGANSRFDLIPSRAFEKRLPDAFVSNYIHWYNHTSGQVIFRPRENPWSTDTDVWRLKHDDTTRKWRLMKGSEILVSMVSTTASTLSKVVLSLEDAQHVHVVLDTSTQVVDIRIPRLQLAFFVKQDHHSLYSRQFRGMVIDTDQGIGSLIGLASKLVLKRGQSDRMILIPVPQKFGRTSIMYAKASNAHHVTVSVNKDKATKVYAYTIDGDLGRIVDSGDLESKLLMAYLHAITSTCLPDPLIGMTGTEASLQILQSAAVRSFDLLTPQNIDLLGQIASLSTTRVFYPSHERVMQTVAWDSALPSLSQHASFRRYVSDIFDHAANMQPLFPGSEVFRLITDTRRQFDTNHDLDERDQVRTSTFRVPGFGAELATTPQVERYAARDRHEKPERGRRAYVAAILTQRNGAALSEPNSNLKDLLLTHFSRASVRGLDSSFDSSSLCYDSKWLGSASGHFKDLWCSLHQALAAASAKCNKFDITAWFCTMAYAESADMSVIQAMIAIYKIRGFASVQIPRATEFDLAVGNIFEFHEIETIVRNKTTAFVDSEEEKYPRQGSETNEQHVNRIEAIFNNRQSAAIQAFVTALQQQWPVRRPSTPNSTAFSKYLRPSEAMAQIVGWFEQWYDNQEFLIYLTSLSTLLARQATSPVTIPRLFFTSPGQNQALFTKKGLFSAEDIFAAVPPSIHRSSVSQSRSGQIIAPIEPKISKTEVDLPLQISDIRIRLEDLCQRLQASAVAKTEHKYIEQLRFSCAALDVRVGSDLVPGKPPAGTRDLLQKYLHDCKKYFRNLNDALLRVVMDGSSFSNRIGISTDHSVRLNPRFWLSQLHRDRFHLMSEVWKEAIIEYGLAITDLHRATRLVSLSEEPADLYEELRHVGHSNWDPMRFPETLLLEAESGIMVRKEQELIAAHMRTPKNGENIVLQLLMGGGKSSVIVPILAAYLTDKEKLVRIVIAKAQSQQMLQMLVAKLGGILDRRVYHMPFSRNLKLSLADAKAIQRLYEDCVTNRGVLLIQPEHILSFKLMAIESLLTDQVELARSMLSTQQYFDEVTRDIIDESDENYSTKFELIYTMGSQESIDFAPERWLIIQQLLALLPRFAYEVHRRMPEAIDIQHISDGKYPRIRFLNKVAADEVLNSLAKHIVDWGLSGLPTRSQPDNLRIAILRYIAETELETAEVNAVEHSKFWTTSTKPPLLLVRGLIAGGVLRFAFSTKRWRVNFGLDQTRIPHTSLAVPFRSKDAPSPRSEFSHPDVVIILTLLSQYYGGLTDEQLFDTLTHVLSSDQAAIHYEEFVCTASSSLPAAFRQLTGVSIRDRHQCIVEVFPALRYSKNVADYYLSRLVFPKQCKQFPQKLSASGWDLGAIKTHPTTGFSGTNDTLHLLPLDVKHLDLATQSHTNAQVLAYLLKDETQVELLPSPTGESFSDGEHLLGVLQGLVSDVRVILDCGASILELSNREVSRAWLGMRSGDIQAVVYFENEQLSVLDRTGRIESFQTSPYAKQMDSCIVYLDEAHTRGTDLKLPRNYRAAVTLGAQLTKDRLTQACMRLRKLGHGQAVTFIVPEEIATKIRNLAHKPAQEAFTSTDVLCWAISETWQDLKRSMPLWAVQGQRFESRKHLSIGVDTTKEQTKVFLENEAQGIEARYKPRQRGDDSSYLASWDISNKNISQIISRCRNFEAMGFGSAALSEEQERELAPEIEEERQVERPPRMVAEKHALHPDLLQLVDNGRYVDSLAFEPAFKALRSTSAAELFDLDQLPSFPTDLLVTEDFMRTVKPPAGSTRATFISDSYSRPVQFVLSVPSHLEPSTISKLIVISPFEANKLLPRIRKTAKVTAHLFAPRSNAGFAPLDQLMLYNVGRAFVPTTVSRSLTIQLNLFSGTLYFRSLSEHDELCDFLGLLRTSKPEAGQEVYADGFLDPPAGKWGLKQSPVPFLRALLTKIRREGEGVEKTHVGKLLNGVRLEDEMFN